MNTNDFMGKIGMRYFAQYKPSHPVRLATDAVLVPAGWWFPSIAGGTSTRATVSYFVAPSHWSESELQAQFRDWIAFDSLAMYTNGAYFYDNGSCVLEPVRYWNHEGNQGDANDRYKEEDYSDVTRHLVRDPHTSTSLPIHSYANLYELYLSLGAGHRDLIEWLVSGPPTPSYRPMDSFCSPYWELLHLMIALERCLGTPPRCEHRSDPCEICGAQIPAHAAIPRRQWIAEQLLNRMQDSDRVKEASLLIDAGLQVRNRLSHGPTFDRSRSPAPQEHGHTEQYDPERAADEYTKNSQALFALIMALGTLAHRLVVADAYHIRHFPHIRPLRAITMTHSGRVA